MTDLALGWDDEAKRFDLIEVAEDRNGNGLAEDADLATAVLTSLFTWGRAGEDDPLPDPTSDDRRGYWADTYLPVAGRRVGSRLWLLEREIVTAETVARFKQYAEEALQWLIEDGVAAGVVVQAWRSGVNAIAFTVDVRRRDGQRFFRRYDDLWQQLVA